jgi:hypothetical protein
MAYSVLEDKGGGGRRYLAWLEEMSVDSIKSLVVYPA